MQSVFEAFKGIFFLCTILIGLLRVIGHVVFDNDTYVLIIMIMMPGYLLLLGLMVGYILSNIQIAKYDKYPEYFHSAYKRGLVIGIVLGVVFASIYLGLYYTGNISI